ncbi:helix-turn-helix domain-containing protein [Marinobacter sp. ELB17]|uniref:helix-turn-helix domain-containing protein n=1 Tax=Marinobacter sp. ELB17 TaxID=270374 RepID=UPI00056A2CA4|nr:helix-turn-helix domain-containing protein [Marinobacter sp. ELB17]
MKITVSSVKQAGMLVRAVRKSQSLRQDDLAGSAGVGHVFVRDAERGKETIEFGRFLRLLDELGICVTFDIPESALPQYEQLKATGMKPLPPRERKQKAKDSSPISSGHKT